MRSLYLGIMQKSMQKSPSKPCHAKSGLFYSCTQTQAIGLFKTDSRLQLISQVVETLRG